MILYGFYMILYGFHMIVYCFIGFYMGFMILLDFYMTFIIYNDYYDYYHSYHYFEGGGAFFKCPVFLNGNVFVSILTVFRISGPPRNFQISSFFEY